jgi:hypothetical protein
MARASEVRGWSGGAVFVALTGVVLSGSSCQGPQPFLRGPQVIECQISRPECNAELLTEENTLECTNFDLTTVGTPIVATTCYDPAQDGAMTDKCMKDFCNDPSQSRDGFNDPADNATCTIVNATLKPFSTNGICGGSGSGNVDVAYATRHRKCDINPNNVSCDLLEVETNSNTVCVSTSPNSVISQIIIYPPVSVEPAPPSAQDGTRNIISVAFDNCSITAPADFAYAVSAGVVATGSGAGVTVPISATSGSLAVKKNCSDDVFGCVPTSIDSLRMNIANTTVAGMQLTNVTISSVSPAPVTSTFGTGGLSFSVPVGALSLVLDGYLGGVRSTFAFSNSSALPLTANASTFSLTGNMAIGSTDASGHSLPISISTTLSGKPATGQQASCSSETGLQRLFGFEDAVSWSSSQATLSSVSSPVTQGCNALGINGQGYMTINGDSFQSSGLALGPALSVDLFIPKNQPNLSYLGALQMYLTCPSGNVFNAYIGQDELTGKPLNAYSTFRYPLPSSIAATLQRGLSDCFFSLALNANQTGQTWILDNLRFTP